MPNVLLVNEIEDGTWIVCWEIRETPQLINLGLSQALGASATFRCANYDFKILFKFDSRFRKVNLDARSESFEEEDKQTQIIGFHQGERQRGLLKDEWQLSWKNRKYMFTSDLIHQFKTCYPENSCNFQIIIKFPRVRKLISDSIHLVNNLSKLLRSESLSDVQIIIKGQRIPAHSAIIAASSPVFSAMFQQGKFKEAQIKIIEIEEIEVEVFHQLLQYLYTGKALKLKNPEITEPLLLAADKYQVIQLKSECEACLISNMTVENAIHYLVLAHLYSAPELERAAIECLVEHRHKVWTRKEWKELNKSYPDLFYEACERLLNYSSERDQREEGKDDQEEEDGERKAMLLLMF